MTEKQIEEETRNHHKRRIAKLKGYTIGNPTKRNAEVFNKCLDYYFNLKVEALVIEAKNKKKLWRK